MVVAISWQDESVLSPGFSRRGVKAGGTFDIFSFTLRPTYAQGGIALSAAHTGSKGQSQGLNPEPLTAKTTFFPSIVWERLREGRGALARHWAQALGRIWEPPGAQHPDLEKYWRSGFLALGFCLGGHGLSSAPAMPRKGS